MNEVVRVGLDVTPLIGAPSGIHQVTRGLLDALIERDDVDVSGWMLSARGAVPDLGIDVHTSRLPARVVQRLWQHGSRPGVRSVAGEVDVAHGTNFLAPPSPRSIISVQDLTPITHPEWVQPAVRAKAGALRHAVERGAMIHTSSEAVADEVVRTLGTDEAQIAVVHHAVNEVADAPRDLAVTLAGSERFVLVMGTVERRKNVTAAVSAIAALPKEVNLVIAGTAGNDEQATRQAIAESSASERIRRIENLSGEQHAALVRHASVLCFPSLYEGFGLPPLEALRVGTAVVATAVGALPELISDRVPLVPPGDTVALTEALAAVVEDPSVDQVVTDRIAAMTWARATAEMASVYRRVATRAG